MSSVSSSVQRSPFRQPRAVWAVAFACVISFDRSHAACGTTPECTDQHLVHGSPAERFSRAQLAGAAVIGYSGPAGALRYRRLGVRTGWGENTLVLADLLAVIVGGSCASVADARTPRATRRGPLRGALRARAPPGPAGRGLTAPRWSRRWCCRGPEAATPRRWTVRRRRRGLLTIGVTTRSPRGRQMLVAPVRAACRSTAYGCSPASGRLAPIFSVFLAAVQACPCRSRCLACTRRVRHAAPPARTFRLRPLATCVVAPTPSGQPHAAKQAVARRARRAPVRGSLRIPPVHRRRPGFAAAADGYAVGVALPLTSVRCRARPAPRHATAATAGRRGARASESAHAVRPPRRCRLDEAPKRARPSRGAATSRRPRGARAHRADSDARGGASGDASSPPPTPRALAPSPAPRQRARPSAAWGRAPDVLPTAPRRRRGARPRRRRASTMSERGDPARRDGPRPRRSRSTRSAATGRPGARRAAAGGST